MSVTKLVVDPMLSFVTKVIELYWFARHVIYDHFLASKIKVGIVRIT